MPNFVAKFLCSTSIIFLSLNAQAADRVFAADAIIYVEGGIKPGPLDPNKVWVVVKPKINTQVFNASVDLRADIGNGPDIIGSTSCGFVNLTASPSEIPSNYNVISCNPLLPANATSDGLVHIPKGAKISAAIRAAYPIFRATITQPGGKPGDVAIRGAFTKSYENKVQRYRAKKQIGCPDPTAIPPKPQGGPKRLVIHTTIVEAPTETKGLIHGKAVCMSVTPQGSSILGLALRGALYQLNRGQKILVGTFQCETLKLEDKLVEGKELVISDTSCSPKPSNIVYKKGQNFVADISASFSSDPDDKAYDAIVPITAYLPWNGSK